MNLADNKEFRAVLYDLVKEEHSRECVETILDKYDEAIAIWLKHSEQVKDGYWHGQNKEFVFRLHHVPDGVIINHPDHPEGIEDPEHYRLHVKASANTLRSLSEKFGLEVKNG